MSAILYSSASPSFLPAGVGFSFYEQVVAESAWFDYRIASLGGGWYRYGAPCWSFTYRVREWSEEELRAIHEHNKVMAW